MTRAPRVVLDTNVWLDLLVFDDPRVEPLREALRTGAVVAACNDECREEWRRVLGYPLLGLDAMRREALLAAFDALVEPVAAGEPPPLPRCADPDDQKFLVLAAAAGARWLLSRDHALLALARRAQRDGLFEIVQPRTWRPVE